MAAPERVTREDVLQMMADVPMCEFSSKPACTRPRGMAYIGPDANEIADAIVAVVDGSVTGSVLLDASLMATYAEFESNGRRCAHGDWDKVRHVWRSWGAWQERTAWAVACNPAKAARYWVNLAHAGQHLCSFLPKSDNLVMLNSGYCHVARGQARHRYNVAVASVARLSHRD